MAWDSGAKLADAVDVLNSNGTYTNRAGGWVWASDVPTASANRATPASGTMLLDQWFRALVHFQLFMQGITLGGGVNPTAVDIEFWIEEADDTSGTNAQVVCPFIMGSAVLTSTGHKLHVTAADTTKRQFATVGLVTKPALRFNSTVALTGGTTPTAQVENVTIYARGIECDIPRIPANE